MLEVDIYKDFFEVRIKMIDFTGSGFSMNLPEGKPSFMVNLCCVACEDP